MKILSLIIPAFVILTMLGCAATQAQPETAATDRPPNIVLIMADDLGYGGLSCYGSENIRTPHLDALAQRGLLFTDFHSNGAVCSPTRAALVTGRYQQRTGVDQVVNADPKHADHHQFLKPDELTFAELLKAGGYRTAIFGKWHLGYAVDHNPTHHGFETFRGFVSGNIDYHSHRDRMNTFDWWIDRELKQEEGYSTHLINRHTVDFIRENKDQPFIVYVAHEAIHGPWQGPTDPPIRGPNRRPGSELQPIDDAVRAMATAMDQGVGEIVAVLDELDLTENTIVWFISDNGGDGGNKSTGPLLRGMKGSVWEGGHRVPAIVSWPGKIEPGTTTDATTMTMDIMPTLATICRVTPPADYRPDGVDISPLLLEGRPPAARTLFWNHFGREAVRQGPWKLVVNDGPDSAMLFNLDDDLKESTDLAAQHPQRVARMLELLDAWREDVTGPNGE